MDSSVKSVVIRINNLTDITEFVRNSSWVDGDIEIRKGRWCVDASSLMGVLSIDMSSGVTVVYPESATDFENYIQKFIV